MQLREDTDIYGYYEIFELYINRVIEFIPKSTDFGEIFGVIDMEYMSNEFKLDFFEISIDYQTENLAHDIDYALKDIFDDSLVDDRFLVSIIKVTIKIYSNTLHVIVELRIYDEHDVRPIDKNITNYPRAKSTFEKMAKK